MLELRHLSSTRRLAAAALVFSALLAPGCRDWAPESLFEAPATPDAAAIATDASDAALVQDSAPQVETGTEELPDAAVQPDAEPMPYDAGGGSKPFAQSSHAGKIAWFQVSDSDDVLAAVWVSLRNKWYASPLPGPIVDNCLFMRPEDFPTTGDPPDVKAIVGGDVHIFGTNLGPVTLTSDSTGFYPPLSKGQTDLFDDFSEISIETTGSEELPPVKIAGEAPAKFTGLDPDITATGFTYDGQSAVSLSWTPAGGNYITYFVFCSLYNPMDFPYASCYSEDNGHWTMPPGIAESIKNSGCSSWRIQISRWNEYEHYSDGVTTALSIHSDATSY